MDDKVSTILRYCVDALFVCSMPCALTRHGRLFLVVPVRADAELGFPVWVAKVAQLSAQLSLPIQLHCTPQTRDAIAAYARAHKLTLDLHFHEFQDWEDLLIVFRNLQDDDLMMIVGAAVGQTSYNRYMDRVPEKLARHFPKFNKILVYPQ